nr:MAG TPA: hypothetical protein [Caudoviricetes sp.]
MWRNCVSHLIIMHNELCHSCTQSTIRQFNYSTMNGNYK